MTTRSFCISKALSQIALGCALAATIPLASCSKDESADKEATGVPAVTPPAANAPAANAPAANAPAANAPAPSALLTKEQLKTKEICAQLLDPATLAEETGLALASLKVLAHGSGNCNVGTGATPYRIGLAISFVEESVEKADAMFSNITVSNETKRVSTTFTDLDGIGNRARLSKQTMGENVDYNVHVLERNVVFGVRITGKTLDDAAEQEQSKKLAAFVAGKLRAM